MKNIASNGMGTSTLKHKILSEYPFNLKKIGEILKQAREKRNVSIEDISTLLYIKKSIVTSIEEGVWDSLPHEVYTKGYIKQYALYLGVYKEIEPYLIAQIKHPEIDDNKKIIEEKKNKRSFVALKEGGHKALYIYAVIILLFLGFLVYKNIEGEHKQVVPQEKENIIQPIKNELEDENKSNLSFTPEQKVLTITCHERTWISVIIDGKEKKEFMLKPQEVVILNGMERFDLLIGNAGGVKLFLNGKDTGFTGEKGQVKRFQLS